MSDYETKLIFAQNLNHHLEAAGETQIDLARILGVSKSTVSSWCTGVKMPRMDKVDTIARHFSVKSSDLIDSSPGNKVDAASRALLKAARPLTPENRQKLLDMAHYLHYTQQQGSL